MAFVAVVESAVAALDQIRNLRWSGRVRTTARLCAGPLLVLFGAEGSWTLIVEE